MSSSAVQRVFSKVNSPLVNGENEYVTYDEFRGFVTETRSEFAHLESRIDWLSTEMNLRFENVNLQFDGLNKRFDDHTDNINRRFADHTENINKRFDDMNRRFDEAMAKSHREFVGTMLGFLSVNLVIIGSVIGVITTSR